MAVYTEFCCKSGGSNKNAGTRRGDSTEPGAVADFTFVGGGFVNSTRVFTPASGNPSALGVAVGDYVALDTGGTDAVYIARLTAVSTTNMTLSATGMGTLPADGTMTLRVGGAWAGPNGTDIFPFGLSNAFNLLIAGQAKVRINLKNAATYSVTVTVNHNGSVTAQGYNSTYGDGGRCVIDGGITGASYVLLTLSSSQFRDVVIQNNGATGTADGIQLTATRNFHQGIVVNNVRGNGITAVSATHIVEECEAYACNQSNTANFGGFCSTGASVTFVRCTSHDNAGSNSSGFVYNVANVLVSTIGCLATINGQYGINLVNSNVGTHSGNTCDSNGAGGINASGNFTGFLENNLLTNNAGFGINGAVNSWSFLRNNAYFGNSLGTSFPTGQFEEIGAVTLTGSPYKSPSTGDYSLNSTAGAGAAVVAAGRGAFVQTKSGYSGTVSSPNIGAVQARAGGVALIGEGLVYG